MGAVESSVDATAGDVVPISRAQSLFDWQEPSRSSSRRSSVQLALTCLSPSSAEVLGVPAAYHSSLLVDGDEYSFSRSGLVRAKGWLSHRHLSGPTLVLSMGESRLAGMAMAKALRNYFQPNTYDLLLKNCNHFSDCALFYLLGRRLPDKYKAAEQLGASVEKALGLIKMLSLGDYKENPQAVGFDSQIVLKSLGSAGAADKDQSLSLEALAFGRVMRGGG
eukprot:TRINITY_DN34066_c0_g1_i1.p1 TRINITY_DN34066_c0_g1~~TRINITY_DN34066_c0_g1_i1.p1  ORF type:complete len:228 (-),score=41.32 TRINITY_DN34066_c0_g1_i1:75-737(-)